MPNAYRWAGAPAGGGRRGPGRAGRRAWRRRSRRAQVSAVATILGLLLVVTVIANYLSTTLPNTMGQNDLQHELQVENQISELSALVGAIGTTQAVGAEVSEPLTLGSQGAPPFAGPDGASLVPLVTLNNTTGNYPQSTFSFTLSGQTKALASSGSAGFVVRLWNTYAPAADVAFDQGAVVFAEAGGLPIFLVPPSISLSSGVLTVFLPRFSNSISSESGTGASDILLRMVSTAPVTIPSAGIALAAGSNIVITVVSPFAAAWYAYFAQSTLSSYVTCTGPNQVCTALLAAGGLAPLGTVTLTIPVSVVTKLQAVTTTFSTSIA